MKRYHYVYLLLDDTNNMMYIGKRSSKCIPDEDIAYMSSSKYVPKDLCDKIVLAEFATAKEAVAYEIELHTRFDVGVSPEFYNRARQTSTGFDTTGIELSKEHIQKVLMARANMSEEQRSAVGAKIGNALRGRKRPDHSENMKGSKHPRYGKHLSEESKRNISEAKLKASHEKRLKSGYYDRLSEPKVRKVPETNTSGHMGINWIKPNNVWQVRVTIDGKRVRIGTFKDIEQAIVARDNAINKVISKSGTMIPTGGWI